MRIPFLRTRPRIQCDACGRSFEPQLREVPTPEGGVLGLFTCPRCSTDYESYSIDAKGLRIREQLAGVTSGSPTAQRLTREMRLHVHRGRGRLAPNGGLTGKNPTP